MPKKPKQVSALRSKMIFAASQMPPTFHWDKSKHAEFSYNNSDVCKWLAERPEFKAWLMQKAQSIGAIAFQNGKWVGVNHPEYKPETEDEPQSSL